MIKVSIFSFFAALAISFSLHAQQDTSKAQDSVVRKHSRLRISIITGSPGLDPMESFGHSCIRVVDSDDVSGRGDLIYNYGFYEEFTKGVYAQWASGRMNCFLETVTYNQLITQFQEEKRGLTEQLLILTDDQKERINSFLKDNIKNEKRYYEYDSFYDNCTTRIMDMLVKTLGPGFVPGQVIGNNSKLTFRDVSINLYCPQQHKYWFGLGLNLLFGSRTDRVMSNNEAMYDPWYICQIIDKATLNGKKLSADKMQLTPDATEWASALNEPFIWSIVIALITIGCLLYSGNMIYGKIVSLILLLVTGIMGCYMVYFWMMDCEPAWKENYNILWALPTNLIIPFFKPRIRKVYAVIALLLIGAAIVLHLARVQEIPLFEIAFVLLSLVFVYAAMYKRAALKSA